MSCLVCGGDLKEIGKLSNKRISKCSFCGLGQTDGLNGQKENYHRDETYIEEEQFFKNIFQKRLRRILKFKKSGTVLEVGCSTGIMLELLKNKGWETLGIEISQEAVVVARERGVQIINDKFEDVNLSKKFDLVIFNHSLEHLENPMKTLEKVSRLLSKGGIIYIDVPNFGGLSAKLQGTNWPLLLPEEHYWHFSYKSLEILLKKMGFKIIFADCSSGIWNVDNPVMEILHSFIYFKKRFFEEILTAVPSWVVSKLKLGSDLMIISRKI